MSVYQGIGANSCTCVIDILKIYILIVDLEYNFLSEVRLILPVLIIYFY